MPRSVLALERDLFFAVKIRDTLRHLALETIVVRDVVGFSQALAGSGSAQESPALAIVNIALPGVAWDEAIRLARQHGLPVLAFGPHVDLEARTKALEAGAQRVVSNAKLSSSLIGLVQELLASPSKDTTQRAAEAEET
ncbi:response regulator [Thermogemmatispora sp.]|uniref:response regulator n=1 Tax=Thermogemmatispora sp. TaxID=1968838 RepID=UPI001D28902D|nr:response regulator [Thermogemmatispora sp.]MBX5450776.1 response regulator [Thermogemmatispora sp.]